MTDSERAEGVHESTITRRWPSMVAVGAGLLAGIAMWPYYMQPVDPSPAYLVPIKSIAGIGTFLAAHPWRIPLLLPFVLWIVSIIRWGPRV